MKLRLDDQALYQPRGMKVYRIKDWDETFESAKSRGYNQKSHSYIPNKHGVGYVRMLQQPDGPGLYGAWIALVHLVSKHPKPRQGYLTDTGGVHGVPYTVDDIASITRFPAPIVERMIDFCSSQACGWLVDTQAKDTAVSLEGILQYPLHSSLSSSSSLSLLERERTPLTSGRISDCTAAILSARPDMRLREMDVSTVLASCASDADRLRIVTEWIADVANMAEPPTNPIGYLRGYIKRANQPVTQAHSGKQPAWARKKAAESELARIRNRSNYPSVEDHARMQALKAEISAIDAEIRDGGADK